MARVDFTRLRRGDRGFVLMEVLGAVVLFAMLIGPLTTCLLASVDRVVKVCERAADLSSITAESASRLAWSWGPMVTSLRWTSGPCAVADIAGLTTSEGVIGLWVDGWFLGEWSLNGDGPFGLPAATWSGLEGRELVARVRPIDGSWGPPWRSTVLPEGYEVVAVSPPHRPPVRGDGPTSGKEIARFRRLPQYSKSIRSA